MFSEAFQCPHDDLTVSRGCGEGLVLCVHSPAMVMVCLPRVLCLVLFCIKWDVLGGVMFVTGLQAPRYQGCAGIVQWPLLTFLDLMLSTIKLRNIIFLEVCTEAHAFKVSDFYFSVRCWKIVSICRTKYIPVCEPSL